MSNRQATYSLNLNNGVLASLEQTERAALKVDGVMQELNRTMSMFGLAFGAGFIINLGKEWVQTAADYEQSMLRIKNASIDVRTGLQNQFFITDIADKFKIDLQTSADAYGHFLFKIKNAGLSNSVQNKLFTELMAVGKVSGLPQGEIDATIRNMSIMLGEGVLEARHLRQLSYVHPQVIPFLADELGLKDKQRDEFSTILKHSESQDAEETKLQKLSQLISSGKLTKLGEPATLLLGAMDKYYDSIKDKVPETLTLVQSGLNDLTNQWLIFKEKTILGDKADLNELFHELSTGIKYLTDHKDDIIEIAESIGHLIKLYTEWRLALFALQLPFGIVSFFRTETERLNGTLALYSPSLTATSAANQALAESEIAATEASEAQNTSNIQKEAIIDTLNKSMEGYIIQQDLFTKSQLDNIATVELLKDEYIQLDMFSADAFRNFGIGTNNMQASLNKFRTSVLDTEGALSGLVSEQKLFIEQGVLFSDSVMSQQISLGGLLREQTLLNESMAIGYKTVVDKTIVGAAPRLANGLAGGISTLSRVAVPVMIAYFAAEALSQLGDNRTKDGYKFSKWDYFGAITSPSKYTEKGSLAWIQELVDQDSITSKSGNTLDNKLRKLVFGQKDNRMGKWYENLVPVDQFGNQNYSDSSLISILSQKGVVFKDEQKRKRDEFAEENFEMGKDFLNGQPVIIGLKKTSESLNYGGDKIKKATDALAKGTTHLKGNSVTNIHISWTGGMNGMVNTKVTVNSHEDWTEDIEEKIGDIIVKKLTDAVNDAQYLH